MRFVEDAMAASVMHPTEGARPEGGQSPGLQAEGRFTGTLQSRWAWGTVGRNYDWMDSHDISGTTGESQL
jgi:hypothetical protein